MCTLLLSTLAQGLALGRGARRCTGAQLRRMEEGAVPSSLEAGE